MYIDVSHPGKMLAMRGGYTRMRPCRKCDGNEFHESQTPPPPTKGCSQPGPKKVKKSVRFFFALKNGSACGPSTVFFHKFFRTLFTMLPEVFLAHFSRFFTNSLFFTLVFSQNVSHVTLTHFSNTFVQSCVVPTRFFIVCSLSIV